MKKIIITIALILLTYVSGYSQSVKAIGLTDSSSVTTTYNGIKTGRFMYTGITNIYMQRVSDGHKDWGTELGATGFYEFDSVGTYPGFYKLYVNSVERKEYGTVQVATFITTTGEEGGMADSLDMNSWRIYGLANPVHGSNAVNLTYLQANYTTYPGAGLDTNYIKTTGATEYNWVTNMYNMGQYQFYNYAPVSLVSPTLGSHLTRKDYVDSVAVRIDTGYVHTTGTNEYSYVANMYWLGQQQYYNYVPSVVGVYPSLSTHVATLQWVIDSTVSLKRAQTITGAKVFTGNVGITGAVTTSGSVTFNSDVPSCNMTPLTQYDMTNKEFVDSSVASITVTPYQEASNHVKIITNGTVQYGKVYQAFSSAISYFASPSGTNPCWVELVGVGNTVTLSHAYLVNYVNVYSDTKDMGIVLGSTGASVTKTMTFRGCKIFMGAGNITTARTYNSVTFEDCEIYAYRDLTLTNCTLKNTVIYQPTGYDVTYDGSTIIDDCKFTQYTSEGGSWTGWNTTFTDGFKTNYTMPTDPTVE